MCNPKHDAATKLENIMATNFLTFQCEKYFFLAIIFMIKEETRIFYLFLNLNSSAGEKKIFIIALDFTTFLPLLILRSYS